MSPNRPGRPSVSVCIPTRHRPHLLTWTVRSCQDQTVLPDEIVIGDDSDDDRTTTLIDTLGRNAPVPVRYFRNHPPRGQSLNVQHLFETASSDWLILIHDDDWLLPNAVESLTSPLLIHPDIDAVFGKQYLASADGEIDPASGVALNRTFHRNARDAGPIADPVRSAVIGQFPNNGYLVRRAAAIAAGYHDPAFKDGCDYRFGIALAVHGARFFFVDEYTAVYRLSATSILRGGNLNTCSIDMATANRRYRHLLDHRDPELREKVRKDLYRAVVWSGLTRRRRLETLGWALDPWWGLGWWSADSILALSALVAPNLREAIRYRVKGDRQAG
jgi:glycosyltransferase involved in cell wall biosynthesis